MDIPNLAQKNEAIVSNSAIQNKTKKKSDNTKIIVSMILVLGLVSGFWISRFFPLQKSGNSLVDSITQNNITSADDIKSESDLVVGESYGDTAKTFKDSATGTIEKGGVNGEGTHTLAREGGVSQRAALTSSVLDLDLFVGKKVEIKGETNGSSKAGWFLDVGVVKITE